MGVCESVNKCVKRSDQWMWVSVSVRMHERENATDRARFGARCVSNSLIYSLITTVTCTKGNREKQYAGRIIYRWKCEFTTYSAVMCEQWTTGQMKRWKIICAFIHICNVKPNRRDKIRIRLKKSSRAEEKLRHTCFKYSQTNASLDSSWLDTM